MKTLDEARALLDDPRPPQCVDCGQGLYCPQAHGPQPQSRVVDRLARAVVEQAKEVDRWQTAWAEASDENWRLRLLRRTQPPSQAEVEAHHAAGGSWRVVDGYGTEQRLTGRHLNERMMSGEIALTWTAIDSEGRETGWPIAR